jgi:16S rRNA (cytidine1402-2'-O)-methyltransferase
VLRRENEPPLLMRADTRRSRRELPAAPRAHLDEYQCTLAGDLTHHQIDFAAATSEITRDKTQALPLQVFQRALLERVSDRFRHPVPQKVVPLRMAQ